MLQQRVDQHGQQRAVWHHPHQVRGHRGARICQVTNIFDILLQVTAAATLPVSPRHASLLQNVPGDRADRRGTRPHPAARGALLLRPQGQRGQAHERGLPVVRRGHRHTSRGRQPNSVTTYI